MTVRWKKIAGFRLYEISDCGEVRRISDGKTSNQYEDSDGYPVVKIKNDAGKYVRERIHKLVYKSFRRKQKDIDGGIVHIDRDVFNNHISNLRFKKYCRKIESEAIDETIAPIKVEVQLDEDFDDIVFLGNGDVKISNTLFNNHSFFGYEILLTGFIIPLLDDNADINSEGYQILSGITCTTEIYEILRIVLKHTKNNKKFTQKEKWIIDTLIRDSYNKNRKNKLTQD